MKSHIVENGIVVNTIMATVEEAQSAFPELMCIEGETGAIGWTWDGSQLSAPKQDINTLRSAKNNEINAARLAASINTFDHLGKAVSCDQLSRSDIDGINGFVALNGAFPEAFPGAWKCADNTYLTISTIDGWKAFYGSMVAAGSALYAHAQALKSALADATTAEQIAAVVW